MKCEFCDTKGYFHMCDKDRPCDCDKPEDINSSECMVCLGTGDVVIKQRHSYDCAVCCVAMYTGLTWEIIAEALELKEEGISTTKCCEYLWSRGYDVHYREGEMPTKGALVIVKSKNFPGKHHMIYFNGTKFIDPTSLPRRYRTKEDVLNGLVGCVELE